MRSFYQFFCLTFSFLFLTFHTFPSSHLPPPPQSCDNTVFFFTVGEKYNPIGFVHVPGPVQALEWSPHSHVSQVSHPLSPKCLCDGKSCIQPISVTISPRLKAGCSSCVRVVMWSRFTVLIRRHIGQPKPSS